MKLFGSGRGSTHSAYWDGPELVVEWYDFGEDAPYESVNILRFGRDGQGKLRQLLGARAGADLKRVLTKQFETYFEARRFADEHQVPYDHIVDFQP